MKPNQKHNWKVRDEKSYASFCGLPRGIWKLVFHIPLGSSFKGFEHFGETERRSQRACALLLHSSLDYDLSNETM